MKRLPILVLTALVLGGVAAAQETGPAFPDSQQAWEAEIEALPWEFKAGEYVLFASRSRIKLRQGLLLLRGAAAERFVFLNEGVERPETEAVLANPDSLGQITFSYHDVGYVTTADWEALDPDELLEAIVASAEEANVESRQYGLLELQVTGWVQEPTFDAGSHAISWALDADDGTRHLVNAVALTLGRHGFEMLTWAGTSEQYAAENGLLQTMLESHAFEPGSRYTDHAADDELAEFGIASLVTVTAGAGTETRGAENTSVFAGLEEFAWVFILAVIGALAVMVTLGERHKKIKARVEAAGTRTAEVKRFVPPDESPRGKGPPPR